MMIILLIILIFHIIKNEFLLGLHIIVDQFINIAIGV